MFFLFLLIYGSTALKIAVIGDAGVVSKSQVDNFKGILKENVDTFFAVGDNFYQKGTQKESVVYQFERVWGNVMKKNYTYPPLFINGNHDHLGDPTALSTIGRIRFPKINYYTKYEKMLEVISIDSTVLFDFPFWNKHKLSAQEQRTFLKRTLAQPKQARWRMVLFHHNIISVTKHFQEKYAEKQKLVELFDEYKVDFVVGGHSHCFEYCKNNHTNYFVLGAGAKLDRGVHGTNPKCKKHLFENGYGVFNFLQNKVDFEYKSKTGFKKTFL